MFGAAQLRRPQGAVVAARARRQRRLAALALALAAVALHPTGPAAAADGVAPVIEQVERLVDRAKQTGTDNNASMLGRHLMAYAALGDLPERVWIDGRCRLMMQPDATAQPEVLTRMACDAKVTYRRLSDIGFRLVVQRGRAVTVYDSAAGGVQR